MTSVVKLGGEVIRDAALERVAGDLAELVAQGVRLVVVHGGGPQATELAQRLGLAPRLVGGRRVTDAAMLEIAKYVFAGKLNTDLVAALGARGVRGVGLTGADGGLIRAHRRPVTPDGTDFGLVGDVDGVEPTLLHRLLDDGFVPVVCSMAADPAGALLNVNADTVAAELAAALGAERLVLATGVAGVYADFAARRGLIERLPASAARALVSDGTVAGGMAPKLAAALHAIARGVGEVRIIDGQPPQALLRAAGRPASGGTAVVPDGAAPVAAAS